MMTSPAPVSTQITASDGDKSAGPWARLRHRAAYFWVGYLMLNQLERRPWLVRLTRP